MPCSPRGDDSPKLGGELSESANVCDTVKYPSAHGQDRPPRLVMLSSSRFVLLHDAEASANGDVSSSVGGSGNGDGNDAHVPLEDKDMVFHSSWERRLLRYCGNMQFNSNSRALVVVAWFGAIASMLRYLPVSVIRSPFRRFNDMMLTCDVLCLKALNSYLVM